MIANVSGPRLWNPGRLFYGGLALVMLAMWLPFIPGWYTFIHMWRVELAASIFLFATLGFLAYRYGNLALTFSISKHELWLIVFPIVAFIAWSGVSLLWAQSWKSAVHHTVVWAEYLIFYLIVRYLVDQNKHFGKLLKMFIVVLVLFAIPAIIEFFALTAFGGETFFRARFAKYGEQVVTLLPLLMVLVVRSSGRKFYAGVACVVAVWLMVYCTAGRANLLLFACCVVGIGVLVFLLPRFRRYRTRFALVVLWIIAAPVPIYLFSLAAAKPEVPILSRFQNSNDAAYSTNFRTLINSVSFEMIKSAPLTGVGADNYGMQFNNFRERYATANPSDPNLIYGEVGIVGHAHNEFLQIAAELGAVGSLIFLWFLAGVAFIVFRAFRGRNKHSLYALASVIGLVMFLASSSVSAYSFRLMQNGFVYFLVLAVAAKTLLKEKAEQREQAIVIATRPPKMRFAMAAGMACCLVLATYSTVRVASAIVTGRANYTEDFDRAATLYRQAMVLDDENPDVRNNFGMRLFQEHRFAEAAPLLEESIRIGRAESTNFSYLASAQSLAGDNQSAEKTMAAAAVLYPRSPFVLTRHAALLYLNGKTDESIREFGRAREIDYRSANSWWTIINNGAQTATNRAFQSPDYAAVMDLHPQSSMYAVLDERYVRFPAEQLLFRRR